MNEHQTESAHPTGLCLVGHGSRNQAALIATEELRARLVAALDLPVTLGFLELAQPDIPSVLSDMVARGVHQIVVQPLMLSFASHVQTDIPMILREFAHDHPGVRFIYGDAFGEDDAIARVAAERVEGALADWAVEDFALLTVGRGADDPQANALTDWLNRRLSDQFNPKASACAFAGAASPTIEEALDELALRAPDTPILVLPYLLFDGYVATKISHAIRDYRARTGARVRRAEPLGPHCAIVSMLKDRMTALQDAPEAAIITP